MVCKYLSVVELADIREETEISKAKFKHVCTKNEKTIGYTNYVGYIKDEDYEAYCKNGNYTDCRVLKGEADTDGNPIFL